MDKQTFENNLLNTCNKIANMMYQEAINTNSELTFDDCFEMAKQMVFKSYNKVIEEVATC